MTIGERIKGARKKEGLSLRALSKRVDLSAQALSKYERNLNVPTSRNLLKLSKALNVKSEFFFRSSDVSISEPVYRCQVKIGKKKQEEILYEVKEWLERYTIAENITGQNLEFSQPKINRRIFDIGEVESVAINLRKEWDLGLDSIDSIISTLENQGIKIGIIKGSDRFDALLAYINNINPVIVVSDNSKGDRQRLNITHELGHLILDINNTELDIEKVALRFGAAFIFPSPTVFMELGKKRSNISFLELMHLKHKYGISMQSIIHRAEELKIISKNLADKYLNVFKEKGWKVTEPGKQYPAECQTRLEKLVIRGICEEIISPIRGQEILGKPINQCRFIDLEENGEKAMALCN